MYKIFCKSILLIGKVIGALMVVAAVGIVVFLLVGIPAIAFHDDGGGNWIVSILKGIGFAVLCMLAYILLLSSVFLIGEKISDVLKRGAGE